jgi:hypothetical protein
VPDKPDRSKSLEELVAEIYTQARNREVLEVLWEECWEFADNVPAVRMQVKGEVGGEMALLLTVINGRSLRLAGYGDTSLFDAIARTLRPIPSAEAPFSLYRYQPDSPDVLHLPGSCRERQVPDDSVEPHCRQYQFRHLPGSHLLADRGE